MPYGRPVRSLRLYSVFFVFISLMAVIRPAEAQMGGMGGMGFGQAVGGISIDAEGIVGNLEPAALQSLADERRDAVAKAGKLEAVQLRSVSLARLITAMQDATKGKQLPVEAVFLGGLTRITHVFVDPEGHDIILAGPGDAISIDAAGNAVGAASKQPLLHLEDFVAALRAIDGARAGGIQCSIDPSAEGLTRLQAFLRTHRPTGPNADGFLREVEKTLGPQIVREIGRAHV